MFSLARYWLNKRINTSETCIYCALSMVFCFWPAANRTRESGFSNVINMSGRHSLYFSLWRQSSQNVTLSRPVFMRKRNFCNKGNMSSVFSIDRNLIYYNPYGVKCKKKSPLVFRWTCCLLPWVLLISCVWAHFLTVVHLQPSPSKSWVICKTLV